MIIVDRVPGSTGSYTGSAIDEKEPNDPEHGGQPLSLPGAVRGRIDVAGDVDAFVIQVPRTGTLSARLTAVDDADLILEIQSETGEVLAASDNGPAKVAEAIPNLYVQPGTLRVVVREFVKKDAQKAPPRKPKKGAASQPATAPTPVGGRATPSQPYVLSVELGPPPEAGEEHEPNDTTAFADELPFGATGRGYVGTKKDVDNWKVALDQVPEDDALTIDVDGVPDVALKVAVLDATGAQIASRRGHTGESVSLRSLAVHDKTSLVFVVVSGDRPNPDASYSIKVGSAPLQVDEETEPNDTIAQANPLSDSPGAESGSRIGALAGGDVDMFKIPVAEAGRSLSLVIEPPSSLAVAVSVIGADEHVVNTGGSKKRGEVVRLSDVFVEPHAELYLKLTAAAGGSTGDEHYKLRWTLVPAAGPAAPPAAEETP